MNPQEFEDKANELIREADEMSAALKVVQLGFAPVRKTFADIFRDDLDYELNYAGGDNYVGLIRRDKKTVEVFLKPNQDFYTIKYKKQGKGSRCTGCIQCR